MFHQLHKSEEMLAVPLCHRLENSQSLASLPTSPVLTELSLEHMANCSLDCSPDGKRDTRWWKQLCLWQTHSRAALTTATPVGSLEFVRNEPTPTKRPACNLLFWQQSCLLTRADHWREMLRRTSEHEIHPPIAEHCGVQRWDNLSKLVSETSKSGTQKF